MFSYLCSLTCQLAKFSGFAANTLLCSALVGAFSLRAESRDPIATPGIQPAASLRAAHALRPQLEKIADLAVWRVVNRDAKFTEDGGPKAGQLDARRGAGIAWLVGSDFGEGTIEADFRGRDLAGQSFVGIAFRRVDDKTYDAVYFRPFNFKQVDPARRARSVQYISTPTFDWPKLREEFPGKYEATVSPVPDPDGWFHARIVIEGQKISVFVNDAVEPSLVVDALSDRRNGPIGLWVGNGSAGDFANLTITPKP